MLLSTVSDDVMKEEREGTRTQGVLMSENTRGLHIKNNTRPDLSC